MRALALPALGLLIAGCAADAAPEEDGPALEVEAFQEVEGSRHLRARLRLEPERGRIRDAIGSGSDYGDYPGSAVNVLFYDLDGRQGRWLFEDNRQRVRRDLAVRDSGRVADPQSSDPREPGPVRAFLYEMIETDSDGDGELGDDDLRTVALSDPSGRRLSRVATGVDFFRSVRRIDDDTVVVFVQAGGRLAGVEVNVNSLEVEREVRIPPVPAGAPL